MSAIVQQARTYIGVRWKHRGRSRTGVDCAGLLWCVYADLGDVRPDLARYGREPFRDGLMTALREGVEADPVWQGQKGACSRSILKLGDIFVMAPDRYPRHLGFIGDDPLYGQSIIHADGSPGVSRVLEVGLSDPDLAKIVAIYRRAVA